MNYYIKPGEWEQILSKLRTRKDIRTKNEGKLRTFIEGIWYMGLFVNAHRKHNFLEKFLF